MKLNPRVSIITPLHNKAPYVAETIRSVLDQTLPEWELLAVENGSADNGPAIVRQFADPRIKLFMSPKKGPGAARNFGLALAIGEWILFLDADDLIEPDYLRERLALAAQYPRADLIVGCWDEFNDGQSYRVRRYPTAIHQPAAVLEQSAIAFAPWALHAAIVRRSQLTGESSWPEALDSLPTEDTAFWFPIIRGSIIAWTERAGALYRLQTVNSRNEIHNPEKWIQAITGAIERNVAFLQSQGSTANARQCANIVRVFERNYRMALKHGSRSAAGVARELGEGWLKKCPHTSTAMSVRKMVGLRIFNLLRHGVI